MKPNPGQPTLDEFAQQARDWGGHQMKLRVAGKFKIAGRKLPAWLDEYMFWCRKRKEQDET